MGTMTISISDEVEQRFRETIRAQSSMKKGVFGKAIQEAINLWIEKQKQEEIAKRQLQILKKGYNFSLKSYKREELYERG